MNRYDRQLLNFLSDLGIKISNTNQDDIIAKFAEYFDNEFFGYESTLETQTKMVELITPIVSKILSSYNPPENIEDLFEETFKALGQLTKKAGGLKVANIYEDNQYRLNVPQTIENKAVLNNLDYYDVGKEIATAAKPTNTGKDTQLDELAVLDVMGEINMSEEDAILLTQWYDNATNQLHNFKSLNNEQYIRLVEGIKDEIAKYFK